MAASKTDEEKQKAVATYFATHNYLKAAELTGIHERTLRRWSKEEWWAEAITEHRQALDEKLDDSYTEIINLVQQEVKDRLENGDEVIVGGKRQRRKVSAKDAATVGGIVFDKRQLLRRLPTSIKREQTDKMLMEKLRNFEALTNAKVIEGTVIEEHAPRRPEGYKKLVRSGIGERAR